MFSYSFFPFLFFGENCGCFQPSHANSLTRRGKYIKSKETSERMFLYQAKLLIENGI